MFSTLILISACVFFLPLILLFDFKMHLFFRIEYLIEVIISFRQIQFQIVLSFYDLILASITLHTISSFFGQGKKAIFDRVAKSSNFKSLLSSVGKALPVSDRTVKDLEVFTIKCVYNDKTSKSLGEARAKKWSIMKRKSTARLPPDEESRYLRALRVAYQAYIWLHFDIPDAPPSPLQYSWQILDGKCVPVRYISAALPPQLTITRDRRPQDSDASDDESDTDSDESTSCDEDSESEDN